MPPIHTQTRSMGLRQKLLSYKKYFSKSYPPAVKFMFWIFHCTHKYLMNFIFKGFFTYTNILWLLILSKTINSSRRNNHHKCNPPRFYLYCSAIYQYPYIKLVLQTLHSSLNRRVILKKQSWHQTFCHNTFILNVNNNTDLGAICKMKYK